MPDVLGSSRRLWLCFVDGSKTSTDADSTKYPVTMAFRNEPYDRALNSVLMSSGLQRLDGNTPLVGTAVSAKSFGPQMSKVFRMNRLMSHQRVNILAILGLLLQLLIFQALLSPQHQMALRKANPNLLLEQPVRVRSALNPIPLVLGLCWV